MCILLGSVLFLSACSQYPEEIIVDYEEEGNIFIYKEKSFSSINTLISYLDKNEKYNITFKRKVSENNYEKIISSLTKQNIVIENKKTIINNPNILEEKNAPIFPDDSEASKHPLFFSKD